MEWREGGVGGGGGGWRGKSTGKENRKPEEKGESDHAIPYALGGEGCSEGQCPNCREMRPLLPSDAAAACREGDDG